ncbi:hypothetical protein [Acetobacterium tundrae]|uniref:Uncharacterized protein n=1 Tax=Acetobacterium tundrae TaxID=132932 RepID=A0ABR6WPQ3_9FIRM|nr:hypothetical protein [Acetobacterium tundrae]MBC3798482.1 hypothetical protein [Acetobacterium tundrae]
MKDPMEITRLTTDEPKNNTETMLNYAYCKDRRAYLRYGNGQENIDLCEYTAEQAKEKGCSPTPEDILEGDSCVECDCELAILYTVAVQAAELRGRLKRYEDAGITLEDLENKPLTIDELKEMSGKPYWHVNLQGIGNRWAILAKHIASNPQDYHYGEYWLAYRREVKS